MMTLARGRIFGAVVLSFVRRPAAPILARVCVLACAAALWPDSRPAAAARSADLPATLRPAVLQALNEDAGPQFAIVAPAPTPPSLGVSTMDTPFRAVNPAHEFAAEFTAEGVRIVPHASAVAPLRLTLAQYGRAERLVPVAMGAWESQGARIERRSLARDAAIGEWYVNGPLGLEQGFTIDAAPSGDGPLALQLAIGDPWSARMSTTGRSVELVERRSQTILTYGELYAFDADGRPLAAALIPTTGGVAIRVDVDGARYPVTIDPFIQQQTLSVAGQAAGDEFGFSVAITADGNTAVVGAPGRDVPFLSVGNSMLADSGAAYVFVRNGQSWALQAALNSGGIPGLASSIGGAETGRRFGHAVAVSDGIAVVTAPFKDADGRSEAGVAYVFQANGAAWTLVQSLTLGENSAEKLFDHSVAMDARVGLPLMAIESMNSSGTKSELHVYVRPGPLWTRRQGQIYGARMRGLAVSGNTIAVALTRMAPAEGSVEILSPSAAGNLLTSVTLAIPSGTEAELVGGDVAVSGDVLLVGAPGADNLRGAGYIFRGAGENWVFEQKLESNTPQITGMGVSAALSANAVGGRAAVLADVSESAHVFRRSTSGWTYEQALNARTGTASLAIGVDFQTGLPQLLVGAPGATAAGLAMVFSDAIAGPAPPPSPPSPPGGFMPPTLAGPAITGSTVQLNWSAAASATSYHVRAGTAPGASNAFDGNVGPVTTMTAASVPNGSYFVRVHAVGGSGESGPSNEVRVDVGPTSGCSPAIAPTNLSATVDGALVTLTWNAAPGAVSYILEAGSAAGLADLAALDVGPGTTFMASAPPATYFVRVRIRNACGATAASSDIIVQVD